jgi:hypothetical protein
MTTIKSVMDDAVVQCSADTPSNWITASGRTYVEMRLHLRKTVDEVLERVDWPDPIAVDYEIAGDGSASYALPSNFKRLTYDPMAVYETTSTRRACLPVLTNGQWTYLTDYGNAGAYRYYRMSGDEDAGFEIEFYRPLGSGEKVTVSYISRNWMRSSGGTAGDAWTAETDVLALPSKVIELGVIWRTRQKKGLPYSDIMAEYEIAISRKANQARQVKMIDMAGSNPNRKPWDVPVPDYIPSA